MRNLNILYLSAIFAVAVIASCKNTDSNSQPTATAEILPDDIVELRDDQQKMAGIDTAHIEWQNIGGVIKATGIVTTAPQNMASVCLPMGGYVKSTSLMAGSAVKKGQELAIIENQEFIDMQQQYLAARNKLDFAQAEFDRHNQLYKEDIYSEQNVQQVNADYKNLKAEVKALEQKLKLIGIDCQKLNEDAISSAVSVNSPISGYIRSVNVVLGKYMSPSDVMFEIVNTEKLLLELTLFEKDAGKIFENQHIRFNINNESEDHEAVIYQTSQSVGSDKTYKVYARVSGACKQVLPGMFVNAVIETSSARMPVVPSDAIVSFDDNDYVFIFEKNKVEDGKPFAEYKMIKIEKGNSDKGYTAVVFPQGFDVSHAIIVVKGAYSLLSAKKNAGEMAC